MGVAGYKVYRNASTTPLTTLGATATSYTDNTVTASTAYTYQVSAVDAAGNESTKASATVTTPPSGGGGTSDLRPHRRRHRRLVPANHEPRRQHPTDRRQQPGHQHPAEVRPQRHGRLLDIHRETPHDRGHSTDDKSAYGGDLYNTTTSNWTQGTVTWNTAGPITGTTKISSVATAVALNTSYLFDVKPLITGNGPVSMVIKSTSSDGARYYSQEGGTSTRNPSSKSPAAAVGPMGQRRAAGRVTASAPTSNAVNLNWTASTDNVGVTGYRVYRNASTTPLTTLGATATSYTDNTVTASTAYTYQVSAVDAAGNESTKASATITTPPSGGGGTLTFAPTDDATVDSSQPTINFGTNTRLTVDKQPGHQHPAEVRPQRHGRLLDIRRETPHDRGQQHRRQVCLRRRPLQHHHQQLDPGHGQLEHSCTHHRHPPRSAASPPPSPSTPATSSTSNR